MCCIVVCVLCYLVSCVFWCVILCSMYCVVLSCGLCIVLYYLVLYVLCCLILYCDALCCFILRCAILCCAFLCCDVLETCFHETDSVLKVMLDQQQEIKLELEPRFRQLSREHGHQSINSGTTKVSTSESHMATLKFRVFRHQ